MGSINFFRKTLTLWVSVSHYEPLRFGALIGQSTGLSHHRGLSHLSPYREPGGIVSQRTQEFFCQSDDLGCSQNHRDIRCGPGPKCKVECQSNKDS